MSLKSSLQADLDAIQALYQEIEQEALSERLNTIHKLRNDLFAQRYEDYLQQARYAPALQFILSDVYSSLNHQQRDNKINKAFSSMMKILPDNILQTIAQAVSYNHKMLTLDIAQVRLIDVISEESYLESLQSESVKAHHIDLVNEFVSLSKVIHQFIQKPFIHLTLKASRLPAKAANLSELQDFLERCFKVFKTMRNPNDFLRDYQTRELEK